MKKISQHLGKIILAVAAVALIIGVVLTFATPVHNFMDGVWDKLYEVGNGPIWNVGGTTTNPDEGGSGEEETYVIEAGLYETGAIELLNAGNREQAAAMLKTSWSDLVSSGAIVVDNGVVSGGVLPPDNLPAKNEYGFYYGVTYTCPEIGLGFTFYEDGSFDVFQGGSLIDQLPAGTLEYSSAGIDMTAFSFPVFAASADGKALSGDGMTFGLGSPAQLAGDLLLPDDGSVTAIDANAFMGQTALTGIEIAATVTSIGEGAFAGDINLTSVKIPERVTRIEAEAFFYCEKLASVTFSENSQLTVIGRGAFSGCVELIEIEIPANITTIEHYAFASSPINTVYYKGTLEQWCSISFITYESNPCYNGADLYINGKLADNITIPASVTSIPDYAFNSCTSLTSVTFEEGSRLTTIGADAFNSCANLTTITIPASVTSIGNIAFGWCDSLRNVTFEEDSQLTTIGNSSFRKCQVLETVTFGNNSKLTTIGETAFFDCVALTSIQIPAGVTTIGAEAFNFCNSLTSITLFSETVIPYTTAMFYRRSITSIYVPSDIVDAYKTADGWASVAEKIKPIQQSVGDK